MGNRIKVLFLCTGNSCRSQMAEGWARRLKRDSIEPHSAGIEARGLNRLAVRAMAEAGVDISRQQSKHVNDLKGIAFDCVITVCADASRSCPSFAGRAEVIHVGFDDPPKLAEGARSEEEAMVHYRRVRDEIRAFVETLPQSLAARPAAAGRKGDSSMSENREAQKICGIQETVREAYGRIAAQGGSCCARPSAAAVAEAVGYSAEELADLPEGANMGLSCGNPAALALLQPGEVVLDLGSGGGFDIFIAARRVGSTGRAIGVDMTPEMIRKARRNALTFCGQTGLDNVEFRLGEIEHLPAADACVDAVISNCVINLSPDKPQVWREIARVLKPGGRVSVSDLALLRPLPEAVRASAEALIGCVAGAVLVDETRGMVRAAGLVEAGFDMKSDYIDRMSEWSDPLYRGIAQKLPAGARPSDYVTSLSITARKPV